MDQTILVVDEDGKFTGEYIPKEVGHTGEGRRHLGICALLYNNKGEVLIQRRKHKRFDNVWDVSIGTHPLHKEDGSDESLEEATWRGFQREYGIKDKIPLQNLGFFNYFARYNGFCENEHCAILVGEYNGPLNLNPEVGYEYKWIEKEEFLKDIEKNPQDYTPWAIEGVKILKKKEFFKQQLG